MIRLNRFPLRDFMINYVTVAALLTNLKVKGRANERRDKHKSILEPDSNRSVFFRQDTLDLAPRDLLVQE